MIPTWDDITPKRMTKGDAMNLIWIEAKRFHERDAWSIADVQRFTKRVSELGELLK